jgi:hypothetical protein
VSWIFPVSRAFFILSRCVSWCAAVSPCIAVVTDIWRTESGRSQRFTEPLAPGFRRPTVPGEEPARPGRSLVVSTIRPTHGPRDPTGSRENPVADIGVSPLDWAELCRQAVCRFICATTRVLLGGRPRAGPRVVCRTQRPATDEPRPASRTGCGAAAAPSADLSPTRDVPAVDFAGRYR